MTENKWEPYFRPTTRVHASGYRCFECGYLVVGKDLKAEKKVVVRRHVDHIANWFPWRNEPWNTGINMDLLKDGNIRLFSNSVGKRLHWNIPGWSDADITEDDNVIPSYGDLDAMWEKQNKEEKGGT